MTIHHPAHPCPARALGAFRGGGVGGTGLSAPLACGLFVCRFSLKSRCSSKQLSNANMQVRGRRAPGGPARPRQAPAAA